MQALYYALVWMELFGLAWPMWIISVMCIRYYGQEQYGQWVEWIIPEVVL